MVLPEALASLPTYCFKECSSLTSVTLPIGITEIPFSCFNGCTSLESLELPSTVETIGRNGFYNCSALASLELPAGVKTIGYNALRNCTSITTIDFPASLTYIDDYAFNGCTALASVTIGTGVSMGQCAFSDCTALTSATIATGVSMGSYAFSGCVSLTSVVLPDNMTELPAYCFQKCMALSSVTWPQALTSIGGYAFAGCRFACSDYSLELPSTVTTIGNRAFTALRHLIIPSSSPVSISSDSFWEYTILYVPSNMVDMYRVRTNWSTYKDNIVPISDYPIPFTLGGAVGEAVDLGLSVKWASWNVGASVPEEYGAYFAWGETEPNINNNYNWANYQWSNGSGNTLTKYSTDSSYGVVDNKTSLDLEDDAAHVNWGGSWRMPTQTEFQELKDNCTSVWTTENGINGRRYTSNKEGYTDKSIFIPIAGRRDGTQLYNVGAYGYYWTSSLDTSNPSDAYYLYLYLSNERVDYHYSRSNGHPIRPVCE